jgi:hypothetical protein
VCDSHNQGYDGEEFEAPRRAVLEGREISWKQFARDMMGLEWEKMAGNSRRVDISKLSGVTELLEEAVRTMEHQMQCRLYLVAHDPLEDDINPHAMIHDDKIQNVHIDAAAQNNFWSVILFITGGFLTFIWETFNVRARILACNSAVTRKDYDRMCEELVNELEEKLTRARNELASSSEMEWVPPGTLLWFQANNQFHAGVNNRGISCPDTMCPYRITVYFAVTTDPDAFRRPSNTSESPFGFTGIDHDTLLTQVKQTRALLEIDMLQEEREKEKRRKKEKDEEQ